MSKTKKFENLFLTFFFHFFLCIFIIMYYGTKNKKGKIQCFLVFKVHKKFINYISIFCFNLY